MVEWQYFPKSNNASELLRKVINCFKNKEKQISSETTKLYSNAVLKELTSCLEKLDFRVEKGRKADQRIRVPVLFGRNGIPEKSFEVDAYHKDAQIVLEIEAGRAVTNYQFLKDLFEACMMYQVKYLVIAIRRFYNKQKDFETVITFFDTVFTSGRMKLPLEGILVIGY